MKYFLVDDNSSYTITVANGVITTALPVGTLLYDDVPAPEVGKTVLAVDVPSFLINDLGGGTGELIAQADNGVVFSTQLMLAIGTVLATTGP